jgi:TrmH family RNA methyltransferase
MITSRDNEKLKLIRKLHERRWRDKLGLFFVEGEDAVEAAAFRGVEPVELLVAGENVEPKLLAAVSTAAHPPRIIGVYRRQDLPPAVALPVRIALWRVSDPGNLGTIVRTLDAFRGSLYLSDGCADPTGPKAVRASAGAVFRVPIGRFEDAPQPRVILVSDPDVTEVRQGPMREVTYVLGSEREGVPREVWQPTDGFWHIPMESHAESLNVAVAAAIALYEWRRQNP